MRGADRQEGSSRRGSNSFPPAQTPGPSQSSKRPRDLQQWFLSRPVSLNHNRKLGLPKPSMSEKKETQACEESLQLPLGGGRATLPLTSLCCHGSKTGPQPPSLGEGAMTPPNSEMGWTGGKAGRRSRVTRRPFLPQALTASCSYVHSVNSLPLSAWTWCPGHMPAEKTSCYF